MSGAHAAYNTKTIIITQFNDYEVMFLTLLRYIAACSPFL